MRPGLQMRIAGAVALLALLLAGTVAREGLARAGGREVRLLMQGYDPHDLLSGHYLAFTLREPASLFAACPPGTEAQISLVMKPRQRWVAIKPSGDHDSVSGAADTRREAAALGPVVVRGDAACHRGLGAIIDSPGMTTTMGVDRFYADQAVAEALARAIRGPGGDHALAIISIGADGRARLKGVQIDGRRFDLNWL